MIGILVVTHANLGHALIETVEFILGSEQEYLKPVSINIQEDPDSLRKKIKSGISKVKTESGVIILTDMFGGTPSNLSYSFLEEGKVEVLSGVNLPLLIRTAEIRQNTDISELAKRLEIFGKKSITLASSILKGNKRSE